MFHKFFGLFSLMWVLYAHGSLQSIVIVEVLSFLECHFRIELVGWVQCDIFIGICIMKMIKLRPSAHLSHIIHELSQSLQWELPESSLVAVWEHGVCCRWPPSPHHRNKHKHLFLLLVLSIDTSLWSFTTNSGNYYSRFLWGWVQCMVRLHKWKDYCFQLKTATFPSTGI